MTSFTMGAVLSVTTGRLMCPIGEVYEIVGFLVDRPVFTHELSLFAGPAKKALLAHKADLPAEATGKNFQQVLADATARFGETLDLPEALRGCIADDRNPIETLKALGVPEERILVVRTDGDAE